MFYHDLARIMPTGVHRRRSRRGPFHFNGKIREPPDSPGPPGDKGDNLFHESTGCLVRLTAGVQSTDDVRSHLVTCLRTTRSGRSL